MNIPEQRPNNFGHCQMVYDLTLLDCFYQNIVIIYSCLCMEYYGNKLISGPDNILTVSVLLNDEESIINFVDPHCDDFVSTV